MSKRPAEEEVLLSPASTNPAKKAKTGAQEPLGGGAAGAMDPPGDAGGSAEAGEGGVPEVVDREEGAVGPSKKDDAYDAEEIILEEENQRNSAILRQLEQLHPEQMDRYESYRRSGFPKASMKRLLQSIVGPGTNVTAQMTIVMSGITKMFVGDLIETSRQVMSEGDEEGPIRPVHVREAVQRLARSKKIPTRHSRPRLFRQ